MSHWGETAGFTAFFETCKAEMKKYRHTKPPMETLSVKRDPP
jgi:hypothetical protein